MDDWDPSMHLYFEALIAARVNPLAWEEILNQALERSSGSCRPSRSRKRHCPRQGDSGPVPDDLET